MPLSIGSDSIDALTDEARKAAAGPHARVCCGQVSWWFGVLLRRTRVRRDQLRLALLFCVLVLVACEQPYRIGEYVLVEWEAGQAPYPAYIIEQKGKARYRVHYDGYADRWDEDVTLDRIKGRVEGHVHRPPPPKKVQVAQGIKPRKANKGDPAGVASAVPVAQYQAGDKVKVRWRGTVYPATVVSVVGPDQYVIHYEGHESAWDETVGAARIVSGR